MANMSTINIEPQYCLFKGEPGTRKSTAALSYPGPQYWFSFDAKMESLLLPMRAWGIDPKTVDFDDYLGVKDAWTSAKNKLEKFYMNCPYKTLVMDSITSIGDGINRQTLNLKGGTTTQSGAEAGKRIGGIAVNTMEDFNAETSAFQEMQSLLKDIHKTQKVNIILIAHIIQTEQKTPGGQTVMSRSIVTGGKRIAAKMPAYVPEIYHFDIKPGMVMGKGGQYRILTTHTGDDFARTALDLEGEISIGNDPLYTKYILPAINRMKGVK